MVRMVQDTHRKGTLLQTGKTHQIFDLERFAEEENVRRSS